MVDILLDKDLKSLGPSSSVKLLTCDFVPSTIDDVDNVKWIVFNGYDQGCMCVGVGCVKIKTQEGF